MLLSVEWLADYIDLDLSDQSLPERLANAILMSGIEVELLKRSGAGLESLVVAEVLSADKHPSADKLKLCRVNDGAGERQIVCGAPNVAAGQKVVLAPPGVTLPGEMKIRAVRIRGEESQGMLCSERELGIGDDHSGIIVLDAECSNGDPAAPLIGLDDAIFEVSITPNRGDCLSILGVAREVSAILGIPLTPPRWEVAEGPGERTEALCGVEILDQDKCPRYAARVVRGVRMGSSPTWMQRRLRAAGMRPINNVVDVTNYVMLSLGQPLHAFDMTTLEGRRIVVRRWRPEDGPFTTLDGQERKMVEDDLMICDAGRPVAIGGIMGGVNTEISDSTEEILLESAFFSPSTIRGTRRRLNISTEASYRFERGVDPAGTRRAADWAIELIRQVGGGRIAGGAVDVHPAPAVPLTVRLRPERVSKLLGMDIGPSEIRRELEALGMAVQEIEGGAFEVKVPVFRHDIDREIDLIEEVARRKGYDALPSVLPATSAPPERLPRLAQLEKDARERMISAGFCEVLNYSFVSRSDLEKLGAAGNPVSLRNPLSADMDVMRTTLLAGLLANTAMNLNRGAEDIRIFEVGRTFHENPQERLPKEVRRIAALMSGAPSAALWPDPPSPVGDEILPARLFDLKGALEQMGQRLRLPEFQFRPAGDASSGFDSNAAAAVFSGESAVGTIGRLKDSIQESWGIRQDIYVFELDIEALAGIDRPPVRLNDITRFPASLRDLAIVVKDEVTHDAVEEIIRRIGGDLLESARLFDIYRHPDQIGEGEKSLAYSLIYRHPERTLNDEEVDEIFWKTVDCLEKGLGGRLRR